MKKNLLFGLVAASVLSVGAIAAFAGSKSISLRASDDLGTASFTLNSLTPFSAEEGVYGDAMTTAGFNVKVMYYLNGCESVDFNGTGRFFDSVSATNTMYDRGVGIYIKAYGVTSVEVYSSRPGVDIYRTASYWSPVDDTKVTTTTFNETVTFDPYTDDGTGGVYIDCPLVSVDDRTFTMFSIKVTYDRSVCANILADL